MTRAVTDPLILSRVGTFLRKVGKDGTTVNGTNTDLSQILAWSVRRMGGTTASLAACSDLELSTINSDDALLDLAEIRALELVQSNYVGADIKVGPIWEAGAAFAEQLANMLEAKRKAFDARYGALVYPPLLEWDVAVLVNV